MDSGKERAPGAAERPCALGRGVALACRGSGPTSPPHPPGIGQEGHEQGDHDAKAQDAREHRHASQDLQRVRGACGLFARVARGLHAQGRVEIRA